jgi:copper chaperone CopZ
MPDILRLTVRGAAGSGWDAALKDALRQIEGVVGVTASYKASLIGITFDASRISSTALRARVEQLGYEVTLM